MTKINAAGCRIPVSRDIDLNVKEIKSAIDRFSNTDVDILCTPECSLSGYLWKPYGINDPIISKVKDAIEEIREYSKKKKVDLILGTARVNDHNHWCNSQLFIVNGEIAHCHDKSILFHEETNVYSPGTEILPFIYKGVKIAGLICNDAWANPFVFHDTSNRLLSYLSKEKVDVVFISANVPTDSFPRQLFYDWHKIWLSMAAGTLKLNFIVSDSTDISSSGPAVCPVGVVSCNSMWVVQGDDKGRSYFSHPINSNNP